MKRAVFGDLATWRATPPAQRKPLVLRGARQVGKSYLVRAYCKGAGLDCLEINFEKEPRLRELFVEGDNSRTVSLLKAHFRKEIGESDLLFLDEIQAAPEVIRRLRYFREETPEIAVIAAGSLLEFALGELEGGVPVGRIEYLFLGPMRFEEYLEAAGEQALVEMIRGWSPQGEAVPPPFHEKLLEHARDYSVVGGMPEAVQTFLAARDYLGCTRVQQAILETYRNDFSKYRRRIPAERLDRVFQAAPRQVGRKWVHARIDPNERAAAVESALDALVHAGVLHRIHHSSGNGVPLGAERKENLYKVLCLDVGLMGAQLGLRVTDLLESGAIERVNEGAIAEQWVGQHLLDLRAPGQRPELNYWVREKRGALAEVDYLIPHGARVVPIEVKAGATARARSLQVFLAEKRKSPVAIHFSTAPAAYHPDRRVLSLPLYLVEQVPRLLELVASAA